MDGTRIKALSLPFTNVAGVGVAWRVLTLLYQIMGWVIMGWDVFLFMVGGRGDGMVRLLRFGVLFFHII